MSTEPVLRLDAVKKAYNAPEGGRVEVLDVERFEVARGEQVALRGSSGSGKTTLLHIIAGLIKPDAGAVHVAGTDVESGDAREIHECPTLAGLRTWRLHCRGCTVSGQ